MSASVTHRAGKKFHIGYGDIVVSTSAGDTTYSCSANGVADDRATILAAFTYAIANMPAVIEFGPGDYGISGGMEIKPAPGARGLTVRGAGKYATRIRFNGASPLVGTQFIAFKIIPSTTPTYGVYADYLKDISFSDIGFYDDNPHLHQYHLADAGATSTGTATGGSTSTMVDAAATLTNARYNANVSQIRNLTTGASGIILSNTTTTVTLDSNGLIGGTRNDFQAGDLYSIALHAGVEESHGIAIAYAIDAVIKDCYTNSIGDESFNFEQVIGGVISGCTVYNGPSRGNGQAINIVTGKNIRIVNNECRGSSAIGTKSTVSGSAGIGLEILGGTLTSLTDIVISNNIISDYDDSGMIFNNSGAAMTMANVSVINNNISNCSGGVELIGNQIHDNFNISYNTIRNVTPGSANTGTNYATGIEFATTLTYTTDCVAAFNTIETVTGRGFVCNGTGMTLQGNNIKGTSLGAIYMSSALGVMISGGTIDSCSSGTVPIIESAAIGKNVTVDGVRITNALSTSYVINRCEYVKNCRIEQAAPYYTGISNAYEIINNSINCGMQLEATRVGGMVIGNRMHTGAADIATHCLSLAAGNDSCIISNNYINTVNGTALRRGINIAAGSDNHVITGNIVVTNTPASGLVNAGAGSSVANNFDV